MGNCGWFDEWTVIGVKCERASTFTHDAKNDAKKMTQKTMQKKMRKTLQKKRCRVIGGRGAEHNQWDRLSWIAPRSNDAELSL